VSILSTYTLDERIEYVECVYASALLGAKHYRSTGETYQAELCEHQAERWKRVLDTYVLYKAERDWPGV